MITGFRLINDKNAVSALEMLNMSDEQINGFLDNKLVSSAFFNFNKMVCFYSVSASRRDLFDKPLSHSIIWNAIIHAKKIGCKYFDFSVLSYRKNSLHEIPGKEKNINTFKKGFGGKTRSVLSVNWEKQKV